jgi:hypothetical protein
VKAGTAEAESVLENGFYRITFTNRGAVVKSWLLTEKEKQKDGTETYKYTDNSGKPFDLVNHTVAPALGYPLSFFTFDQELERKLNEALYAGGAVSASTTGSLTSARTSGPTRVSSSTLKPKLQGMDRGCRPFPSGPAAWVTSWRRFPLPEPKLTGSSWTERSNEKPLPPVAS